jgi:hypothetical protein
VPLLRRLVVTNCTTRKIVGPRIGLDVASVSGGPLALARRWKSLLGSAQPVCLAGLLYKGRSIIEATRAAKTVGAELYVVSAGLGLISGTERVPNYDLTVAPGSPLARMLAASGWEPQDWWTAITRDQPSPLSRLITNSMAYVALPASYLRMVRKDLSRYVSAGAQDVRIFTSEAGVDEVPSSISRYVMPYDIRLEAISGFGGTRAEFPQRAMRHFVEVLRGHELSLEEARAAVEASMNRQRQRPSPERARVSDEQIRALLRKRWRACEGSSTRLLRYLRDDARVSCEQGRFRMLWKTLASELPR